MRHLLAVALAPLLVSACTSSALPPTDASAVPGPAPTGPAGVASVPPAAALDPSCEQVCARIESCSKHPAVDCRADCAEHLAPAGKAAPYLACVQALSCEAITESLRMNSGPLGYCRTRGL